MKHISKLVSNLQGQKMFQIMAAAKDLEKKGRNIIHLEIGDPDFSSPQNVVDAACNALHQGYTHYTLSSGMEEFRVQAGIITQKSRGFLPGVEQILVTPGANIQIYLAIASTVNPGEEVIITDPCFVSYYSIIELCGAKAVKVPLFENNQFKLHPADLKAAISDKTRLIIINSPHNPTGSVMNEKDMNAIYQIAEEADVFLLSDEVYGRMVYADSEHKFATPSIYDQCKERTIIAHSFSKSYAMTGWRIGAITGPELVIKKMALLLETLTSCVSPFIQIAAIEAMRGSQDYVDYMIQSYRNRRDIIVDGLNQINGVSCVSPGGSFYAFPNITKTGMSSEQFSDYILQNAGVATCPGNYFGNAGEGYVRLCFANSEENIHEAIQRIKKAIHTL